MKKHSPDLFIVPPDQQAIDARLVNWAMWVSPGIGGSICPMFRLAKSNSRQWHMPEIRTTCDTKDAMLIEQSIRKLPETSKIILRWYYVHRSSEQRIRRKLHMTPSELHISVQNARKLLTNIVAYHTNTHSAGIPIMLPSK